MLNNPQSYNLFHQFIETYGPSGFKGIKPGDPLMIELEKMMEINDQFFYIGELIQINIIYTSKRSKQLIGVEPEDLTLYHFFKATHPDDIQRLSLGRAKTLKMAHDLFVAEKGCAFLSTDFKMQNPSGGYSNILTQLYLFYSAIPHKAVYLLKVHTNIDWYKMVKYRYHYYLGNDVSNFRFPDEELLGLGVPFSDREFEIIRLIQSGMNSEQIAKQLFLSVHTVNTHRRNILKKSGLETMSELIYDLMGRGLL
jgi:DNA-binding CsgD family transcriptional regulator